MPKKDDLHAKLQNAFPPSDTPPPPELLIIVEFIARQLAQEHEEIEWKKQLKREKIRAYRKAKKLMQTRGCYQ